MAPLFPRAMQIDGIKDPTQLQQSEQDLSMWSALCTSQSSLYAETWLNTHSHVLIKEELMSRVRKFNACSPFRDLQALVSILNTSFGIDITLYLPGNNRGRLDSASNQRRGKSVPNSDITMRSSDVKEQPVTENLAQHSYRLDEQHLRGAQHHLTTAMLPLFSKIHFEWSPCLRESALASLLHITQAVISTCVDRQQSLTNQV